MGCLSIGGRSVPAKRCTADLVAGDIVGDGRVEDGRAAQNHRHLTLHTQPTPFSRGERTRGRVVEARGVGPRPCLRPSALALPRTPSASRSACSRLSKISVKYAKISQNMPKIWSNFPKFQSKFRTDNEDEDLGRLLRRPAARRAATRFLVGPAWRRTAPRAPRTRPSCTTHQIVSDFYESFAREDGSAPLAAALPPEVAGAASHCRMKG